MKKQRDIGYKIENMNGMTYDDGKRFSYRDMNGKCFDGTTYGITDQNGVTYRKEKTYAYTDMNGEQS